MLAENEAELAALMRFCFKRKMPWFVMGGGSNVLVGDGGMRGVVVRLGGDFAAVDGTRRRRVRHRRGGRLGRHGAGHREGRVGRGRRASDRWPAFPGPSAARCA